jgi:hypothetical protein
VQRFEVVVGGICAVVWLLATVLLWVGAPALGRYPPPRSLFSFAVVLGWVAGNVFMARVRQRALSRRALLALYLGGPPGLIWLLWAFVPAPQQAVAPLAPILSLGIFGIFFLVPVTIRRRTP